MKLFNKLVYMFCPKHASILTGIEYSSIYILCPEGKRYRTYYFKFNKNDWPIITQSLYTTVDFNSVLYDKIEEFIKINKI